MVTRNFQFYSLKIHNKKGATSQMPCIEVALNLITKNLN